MTASVYRRDIDGLRTMAVVPVVLNHAAVLGMPGGFVGVDVFFVISGYLISSILLREIDEGRFSVVRFYERRARRILPALFFLLAVFGALAFGFLIPPLLDDFAASVGATLLFVSNIWFYLRATDYFAASTLTEPLLHTWSLAVEEQFYIVFPILLWALMTYRRSVLSRVVLGLVGLSFAVSVWLTATRPEAGFFLPFGRAWELGVGVVLALGLLPSARANRLAHPVALAGFGLLVASILLIDEHMPFPGVAALPPVLGAAALIWAGGSDRPTWPGRLLSSRAFVGIGLISYSLYLWHWPILVALRLRFGTDTVPAGWTYAGIAAAVLAA